MYRDNDRLHDRGPDPAVLNIDELSYANNDYRNALWTGDHLQMTLMTIPVGGDIGTEIHPDTDQFFRVEGGLGLVQMGSARDRMNREHRVNRHDAIFVPAGTWHNILNIGRVPLRLYSIYAPPHHPRGTVHPTKADAQHEGD